MCIYTVNFHYNVNSSRELLDFEITFAVPFNTHVWQILLFEVQIFAHTFLLSVLPTDTVQTNHTTRTTK